MVMGESSKYDSAVLGSSNSRQGICPGGWRIPSDTDWVVLMTTVGVDSARIKLSASGRWDSSYFKGTDNGFRALPAGFRYNPSPYIGIGKFCYFWTASEASEAASWSWEFNHSASRIYRRDGDKSIPVSLRCIRK